MMKILSIFALLFAWTTSALAQESGVYIDNLKSLRVEVNGAWDSEPVVNLGGRNWVEISFDDLQHTYVRYTYTITHCNADWEQSELMESDYMDGFNGMRIEDYTPSTSTAMLYNHYSLKIPNDDVKLKVSGNYKLQIFEDGDDEPVAQACFSVLEPRVGIEISVSSNTDIDTYNSHQQVSFDVNYSTYTVMHPETELLPVVVQNRRWDNHVEGLKPTYLKTNTLVFNHNRNLIFPAGNEYRRFEVLDDHVPTMRIDAMRYEDPYYHAFVMTDEQRVNYIFDKDQNGRYYVRNANDVDSESESEYYITHFRLAIPQIPGGNLYLHGDLTNGRLADEYKMEYNLMEHEYEITLPLKQGSYNYQYLFVPDGESVGQTAACEGNFYQTENEYGVYIYHRPFGDRYDHLVGYNKVKYLGNK